MDDITKERKKERKKEKKQSLKFALPSSFFPLLPWSVPQARMEEGTELTGTGGQILERERERERRRKEIRRA